MTHPIVIEAAQVTAPLGNSAGIRCIAVLSVTTSSQSVDLETLLGGADKGHFLTLMADMPANADSRVYLAFFANAAQSISETATGTGATVCWPLPDKQTLPIKLLSGDVRASGIATLMWHKHLVYKGLATGYLRIYQSSVGVGQGLDQFPLP